MGERQIIPDYLPNVDRESLCGAIVFGSSVPFTPFPSKAYSTTEDMEDTEDTERLSARHCVLPVSAVKTLKCERELL